MSVEPIVSAELVRTADEWAETIRADLGRAVEGIVAAGRNLIAAKADVAHGEWLPMLERIGISKRDAQRFMSIAENLESANFAHLPASPTALYELSRLDADDIEQGIESGTITPDMTIAQARDLVTPRSTTVIRDQDGEEAGRVVDDRDLTSMADDEYDEMLLDEDHEQWEAEQDEIVPGFTADDIADMEVTPTPAPAEPANPRRRPITEAFDSATFELKRAVERVARLAADDRLGKNKDQIQASNLSDLVRVRDAINGVINTLEG